MQPFASDRYQLLSPLGGGGMAEVFLAVATGAEGFRKPVAIKRVLPHLAANEDVARMFLAEARLAMHLHHQNIVSVFDVGRGAEGLYLVMELVDGWDLGQVLGYEAKARRWMPEPLALYVAQQVANGLSHAYRKTENGKPIMAAHRDLTPSNILVTADGEVKIADFGIAKVDSGHTEPGTFKGKIPYAAPEVIRGHAATHLSDQFSLGVVIHRLTSGQYPYGYSDNPVTYNEMLQKGGVPPCAGLSGGCASVVRTMLAMTPVGRYPTIEEAGQALGQLQAKSGAVIGPPQLAKFLAELKLPPTPLSKAQAELAALAAKPAPAKAPKAPAIAPMPGLSDEPLSSWVQPPGPSMDESGRLTGVSAAPPRRPSRELEVEPVAAHLEESPAAARDRAPARGEPIQAELVPLAVNPAPADPTPGYEPLPGAYGAKPPGRRGVPLLVVLLALIALAGVGSWVLGARALRSQLEKITGPPVQPVLTIVSEPDGAQVKISGQVVGTTPFSQDNLYPKGAELDVQVSLRGYKPWSGKFRGGQTVTLEANLRNK